MRAEHMVDAMLQGIEAREPLARVGRLSTMEPGFNIAFPDGERYLVRVYGVFNWDAEMIDNEAGAGMFDDPDPDEDDDGTA